jgi:SAM-dependent methyltransferase
MSQVFGSAYASAYDTLYQDKNYNSECDQIERAFQTSQSPTKSVLDLGCGTGGHAIPLAGRGYEVTGVDRSAEMLARAKTKAEAISALEKLSFQQGDIQAIDLNKKFDAVLMMFAVLGYQLENEQVLAALNTARKHLNAGGLFIFDVWYGPAVLHERPSQRAKMIDTDRGQLLRIVSGSLDVQRQLCTVDYQMWQIENEKLVAKTEEKHTMRFFFPLELELFLKVAGFELTTLGEFPNFDQSPSEATWNVMAIATAI